MCYEIDSMNGGFTLIKYILQESILVSFHFYLKVLSINLFFKVFFLFSIFSNKQNVIVTKLIVLLQVDYIITGLTVKC